MTWQDIELIHLLLEIMVVVSVVYMMVLLLVDILDMHNLHCVDEWNGVSWSTATALPTGQHGGGAGTQTQTVGIIMGGNP